MTLYDQIIDEAEQLAYGEILGHDASDHQIIDAVSEIVNVKLGYNSTGGHLALASYFRIEKVMRAVIAA
jgi:hypothetical protein